MTNQNNNIAATIVPTESGRELLQDIYGGGGLTLLYSTPTYKEGDYMDSKVNEYLSLLWDGNTVLFLQFSNDNGDTVVYAHHIVMSVVVQREGQQKQDWRRRNAKINKPTQLLWYVDYDKETNKISQIVVANTNMKYVKGQFYKIK